MKVVYIAHPLRGDWAHNIESARWFCEKALRLGYAPIAPYLMLGDLLDDAKPEDRALGLEHDLAIIPKCDELWLCGGIVSEGMGKEAVAAYRAGLPIRRFDRAGGEMAEATLDGWWGIVTELLAAHAPVPPGTLVGGR